jgi:hypothetical protein
MDMDSVILVALALLAGTGVAIAQTVAPSPPNRLEGSVAPDSLARPAAPATSRARDGVRNGTTKEERDQHNEVRPGSTDIPIPELQR